MLADDDCYYVVKFRNNPQHARVLVNELVCYVVLDYLSIAAPAWEIIEVTSDLIEVTPELTVDRGARRLACEPGLHFGSRYPVDPARQSVYDYVPLSLLRELVNRREFLGILAFDKWISNADGRQAIFFRARAKQWLPPEGAADPAGREISPRALVYVANMIDHGFAFNAQHWEFSDNPEQGLYTRREIYEEVTGFNCFEPWLDRLRNLPAGVLDDAFKRIPVEWCAGEWDCLEALLEKLYSRRALTPDLLTQTKAAARDPFPNWSVAAARGAGR